MADGGLITNRKAFDSLPTKEKLGVLFDNQVYTSKQIKGYKFYQKISATIGGFLVAAIGFFAVNIFGGNK